MGDAVIRTDASPDIGGGHVMRCLALAEALSTAGWSCTFVSVRGTADAVPALKEGRYRLVEVRADQSASPNPLGMLDAVDLLIVDHYGLDTTFETACRAYARHVLVIDDLANRKHDCDVLLDQTLGRQAGDYAELVPDSCRLLLGPKHALLRPEFARLRDRSETRPRERLERVFVSFGATDPTGMCGPAAQAACDAGAAHVDIAVGSGCPHLEALRDLTGRQPQIQLHVDADVATLMAQADFAIGAAGVTSWERCCLGLPAIVVVTADNQAMNAAQLERSGAAVSVQADADTASRRILSALTEVLRAPSRLAEMSEAAMAICDGRGAERAVDAVAALNSTPALAG